MRKFFSLVFVYLFTVLFVVLFSGLVFAGFQTTDNLGNHSARKALQMNDKAIVGVSSVTVNGQITLKDGTVITSTGTLGGIKEETDPIFVSSAPATYLNNAGGKMTGDLKIEKASGNNIFEINAVSGNSYLTFRSSTAAAEFRLNPNGILNSPIGDMDPDGNLNMGGSISIDGTVDGRDVSVDGTRLDGLFKASNGSQLTNYSLSISTVAVSIAPSGTVYISPSGATEIGSVHISARGNYAGSYYYDVYTTSFSITNVDAEDTIKFDWTAVVK